MVHVWVVAAIITAFILGLVLGFDSSEHSVVIECRKLERTLVEGVAFQCSEIKR